jgi:hypothetical protein
MDLEKESASIRVDTGVAKDIAQSCNELLELQKQIIKCEDNLKNLRNDERLLSEKQIPDLMQQAGISELKLADGSSVKIRPSYHAKIADRNKSEAFTWLRNNNAGDIIKNDLTVSFIRSEDNVATQVFEDLKRQVGSDRVTQKEKVESSTLRAFVREQIEAGKQIPMETFGVYVANKTIIKEKE